MLASQRGCSYFAPSRGGLVDIPSPWVSALSEACMHCSGAQQARNCPVNNKDSVGLHMLSMMAMKAYCQVAHRDSRPPIFRNYVLFVHICLYLHCADHQHATFNGPLRRDAVDLGSNLVQPGSSRGIYSAYAALTRAWQAAYIR